MQGSRIYSDFSPEMRWIQRQVSNDVQSVAPPIRPLARYYTEVRLKVCQPKGIISLKDQRLGRPIPYLAFWFADALGLADRQLRRLSALSLTCSTIATTIRDDMVESTPSSRSGMSELARLWDQRYVQTLREVFPTREESRKVASWAKEEWSTYDEWESRPLGAEGRRPFSAAFLRESSRFYLACALPPLMAIAQAAGRREEVPRIEKFLMEFSMGWKIFDDLMDWEIDLAAADLNRSSVLLYIQNRTGGGGAPDELEVLSWFLDRDFVEDAYGAMIGFLLRASKTIASLRSSYLNRFMGEQIGFQTMKKNSLLESATLLVSPMNAMLASFTVR
jgi:hypothetical protein